MNAAVRLVEVRVPDMGNFKDVAVIDVLVKPGESIEPEAPLVTLETEKATMDVPSTAGGVIEKIHVEKGGKVNAGDLIATVRPAGDGAQAAAPAQAAPAAPATAAQAQAPAAAAKSDARRGRTRRCTAAKATAASPPTPPRQQANAAAAPSPAQQGAGSAATELPDGAAHRSASHQ